jgi:pimeloyl-ACP methyl ester carboxylesterase
MTTGEKIGSVQEVNFVRSKDGTVINFHKSGSGPALILIHGVLSSSSDYLKVARHLGKHFTVYIIERRGRGCSGLQGIEYNIEKECEDIEALQEIAQATILLGHSYGGLIAMEYARKNTLLKKIVVYEPGVSVDGAISMEWVPKYKRLLAEKKYLTALSVFSKSTGPVQAKKTPLWLMNLLLLIFIREKRRRKMYRLLHENLQEHLEVAKKNNTYRNYGEISAKVLLMRGGKSGLEYVVMSATALSEVIPSLVVKVFQKLDHFGPDITGPFEVAAAATEFFLANN